METELASHLEPRVTQRDREEFSVIGRRLPKYDSAEKVSGDARYLIDLKLPGMLYGKILRSRYPHTRIVSIETTEALELEGVVVTISAADTPKIRFGFMKDTYALKYGKVRLYRAEVAAVAAVDEKQSAHVGPETRIEDRNVC